MTRFIAEIGSNHNRDLDRALALIDAAAQAGAKAAKLQVFHVEDLFAPEVLAAREELRARRAWELPPELLPPPSVAVTVAVSVAVLPKLSDTLNSTTYWPVVGGVIV